MDLESLNALLELPGGGGAEGGTPTVRLHGLTVRRVRQRAKDKLCFYMVSDRASGSAVAVELRVYAGHSEADGEMAPAAAAAAIRTIALGSVLREVEGVFRGRWSADGAGRTLSCTRVEVATDAEAAADAPTLLFDLNYWDSMDRVERSAIRRQLRLSYAFNRRSAHAFKVCFGGAGLLRPAAGPAAAAAPSALRDTADADGWVRWEGVRLVDDAEPWRACGGGGACDGGGAGDGDGADAAAAAAVAAAAAAAAAARTVYLCAASPHELGAIEAGCIYVIGGLADHVARPGASLERAAAHTLRTARLPLERFVKMNTRQAVGGDGCGGGGGLDVTTLAVVQMLILRREHASWGEAITRCPALQCAPLRKYVRWLAPYGDLNDRAERPADQIAGSVGSVPRSWRDCCQVAAQQRESDQRQRQQQFFKFLFDFVQCAVKDSGAADNPERITR